MKRLSERYSLGTRIGRGGVGEVFSGWQTALDRPVAIKLLRPELTHHTAVVARFKQEARNTCRLHHPNVVTVHDVGETQDGIHFVVMELLEGETLAGRLQETGPLPLEAALPIARQIARGMAAAEGVGLVHRDLKPENIFLINENHVKILDFGLSTLRSSQMPPTTDAADTISDEDPATTLNDTLAPEPSFNDVYRSGALLADYALADSELNESTESISRASPGHPLLQNNGQHSADPDSDNSDSDNSDSDNSDNENTVYDPLDSLYAPSTQQHTGREGLTRPGAVIGTPRYMSPEQVLGWEVDHRSDLYSFGCILYEMLSGTSPFRGPTSRAFMHQHLYEKPRDIQETAPHLPPAVVAMVNRLISKGPSERFQSWPQLREALRQLAPTRPAPAQSPTADAALPAHEALPTEPYRFLDPFTHVSRNLFYGRESDMAQFMSMWRDPERPPLLILTGASGVGKTSFLSARVIPRLEDADIMVMRIMSGADPIRALRAALSRELARGNELVDPEADNAQLLNTLVVLQDRPLAIVFDQLEELFTSGGESEMSVFQADLAAMVAGGGDEVRFVLSLREDFLGALLRTLHPLPTDQIARTLPLRPLDAADLKAALEGPSQPTHPVSYKPFTFEPGLLDQIVDDLLADPAGEVAPRVQAVGARLWEMISNENVLEITHEHYHQGLGGARGILARLLDESIADLTLSDQGVAKEILRALTHLPGSQTSRPAPESELVAYAAQGRRLQLLRRLEDRWRVIQGFVDPRWPEERTYRITHEALVARIQQYGEEGSTRNRARQIFRHGLTLWLQGGRSTEDLLPEHHFDTVQRHIEELVLRTEEEQSFYVQCKERHNDRWMRQILADQQRRRSRYVRLVLFPMALLLIGVLAGQAPVGFVSFQTARIYAGIRLGWPNLDLSGIQLRDASLAGMDLRNVILTGASLQDSDLQGASLAGVDLSEVDLRGTNLQGADLRTTTLRNVQLRETDFRGADLRNADLSGTALVGGRFDGALYNLGTIWSTEAADPPVIPNGALGPGGQADGLSVPGADLSEQDFFQLSAVEANFRRASLVGTSLMDADLTGASLQGADLSQAHLERTILVNTNLQDARLISANLLSATATGAILVGADLTGADLRDINLQNADLCGADLSGANLSRARLQGATYCEDTQFPTDFDLPSGARLRQPSL